VGRNGAEIVWALVAVRLKIDRGQILEVEQLWDRNINAAAVPLLTTPRLTLVNDIPPAERLSREVLLRAANSYFDALEGDDGKIAAFADDCVRDENGYQTVNNPPPGGRNMPGRAALSSSMSRRAWSQCTPSSFKTACAAAPSLAIPPECCRIWWLSKPSVSAGA
jgi:hypothetical protein